MATIAELHNLLERATTPAEYDRIQAEIIKEQKAASLEKARSIVQVEAAERERKENLLAAYNETLKKIESAYQEINETDKQMFAAVRKLCETAITRKESSAYIEGLELQAIQMAEQMHISYLRRAPALFGGQIIRPKLNDFIKVWLQRYLDYRERLGPEKITLDSIASHGLQGGTETEDFPARF